MRLDGDAHQDVALVRIMVVFVTKNKILCLRITTYSPLVSFFLLGVNTAGELDKWAVELGCVSANLQIVSTSRFERMALR